MKKHITADALLPNKPHGWHDGGDTVLFSFLEDTMPDYVATKDKDGDGNPDVYKISPEDKIGIDADFSMTAAERALAYKAVAAWNEVANVNLVEGTNDGVSGDITFGSAAFKDKGTFGFITAFPRESSLGVSDRRGDLWVNSSNPEQDVTEFGHTSWNTYLHELGHSIGLHHPNEDPENYAGTPHNNNRYTVMSYNPHPNVRSEGSDDQPWPLTPMLYDIEAIQSLYGANTETRGDATSYFGAGLGGDLAYQYGADQMQLLGRDVILTIWDGGGLDLIDVSDLETGVTVDLRAGHFSTIGGVKNNVAVASAVKVDGHIVNLIENVWGSAEDDSLRGNRAGNDLRGAAGDDVLKGARGDDVLEGGAGADRLKGGRGDDVFVFTANKDEGQDRIMDFQQADDLIQIIGGDFDDLVIDLTDVGDASVSLDSGTVIILVGVDYTALGPEGFEFI